MQVPRDRSSKAIKIHQQNIVIVCWDVMMCRLVDSSWNVLAHCEAREGKGRGNWRTEWVASTLHTTSEHDVSTITTADAHTSAASSRLNWRPQADLNGLANAVGSQYPSHYLGTWCIQHYYRWCAHLGCQYSTELTPTGRFKWTRLFRRMTRSGSVRVPSHFNWPLPSNTAVNHFYTNREQCEMLTGYLSLGRRPGSDWANT